MKPLYSHSLCNSRTCLCLDNRKTPNNKEKYLESLTARSRQAKKFPHFFPVAIWFCFPLRKSSCKQSMLHHGKGSRFYHRRRHRLNFSKSGLKINTWLNNVWNTAKHGCWCQTVCIPPSTETIQVPNKKRELATTIILAEYTSQFAFNAIIQCRTHDEQILYILLLFFAQTFESYHVVE